MKVWPDLATRLERFSCTPLALCADFPRLADLWEGWWGRANRRPLLLGAVGSPTFPPELGWDKAFDLLEQPEKWVTKRRAQCEHMVWLGASVPHVRVDVGPVSLAAMVGAPIFFDGRTQTSWHTPILAGMEDGLAARPQLSGPWFGRIRDLLRRTAEDGRGRYLVCLPDLSGAIDTLANLRGSEALAFDLVDDPESVLALADHLVGIWEEVFACFYRTILDAGSAPVQWLHAWSDVPYTLPTCDFNALIGPQAFAEICLPSLRKQAAMAGRCLFHLDGPDAARHAPVLAEAEEITAVQFTPGSGTPSALAKLPMLRSLQEAGKPILVVCPSAEVPGMLRGLDPRGLALFPDDLRTVSQGRELEALVAGARP